MSFFGCIQIKLRNKTDFQTPFFLDNDTVWEWGDLKSLKKKVTIDNYFCFTQGIN